jgi:hypothetical protein
LSGSFLPKELVKKRVSLNRMIRFLVVSN